MISFQELFDAVRHFSQESTTSQFTYYDKTNLDHLSTSHFTANNFKSKFLFASDYFKEILIKKKLDFKNLKPMLDFQLLRMIMLRNYSVKQ